MNSMSQPLVVKDKKKTFANETLTNNSVNMSFAQVRDKSQSTEKIDLPEQHEVVNNDIPDDTAPHGLSGTSEIVSKPPNNKKNSVVPPLDSQ